MNRVDVALALITAGSPRGYEVLSEVITAALGELELLDQVRVTEA